MEDRLYKQDMQTIQQYLNNHPEYKKDYNILEIDPKHPFEHPLGTLIYALALLIKIDKVNESLNGRLLKTTNQIGYYFEAIDLLFTAKTEVIN
ncbi:MAG: hypothetical protein LCH52_08430 [Bacteroidetes bacterium]|nr:hypothetical protein [Bacteroidota bacterium]